MYNNCMMGFVFILHLLTVNIEETFFLLVFIVLVFDTN
jgi:hypothetical protein